VLIEAGRKRGLSNVDFGFLGREIGRGVLFVSANLRVCLYLKQRLRGLLVHAVGVEPEDAGDCVRLVIHRHGGCNDCAGMLLAVGIVLLRTTNTHRDIGGALMPVDAGDQRAIAGKNNGAVLVRGIVADEVRRRIGLTQRTHGALQFLLHHLQQDRIRTGGWAGLTQGLGYQGH